MEQRKPEVGDIVHYVHLSVERGKRCVKALVEYVYVEKPFHVDLQAEGKHYHNVSFHPLARYGWHWPEPVEIE